MAGEFGAGENEVVFLGGEGLTEDNGVEVGDLAGTGGELGHGFHMAEVVGGRDAPSRRRRVGAH